MYDVLSCPFCNGTDIELYHDDEHVMLRCRDCDAKGPSCGDAGWAKKVWNERLQTKAETWRRIAEGWKNCFKNANKFVKAYREHYPNIAQLLDGWHADAAWTEWDQKIRKDAATLGKWADDIQSGMDYKNSTPKSSNSCLTCKLRNTKRCNSPYPPADDDWCGAYRRTT